MTRYSDNGQYEIGKLLIRTNTSNKVDIDLRSVMKDMTIYESLYSDTISGNVTIVESENVVNQYMLGNKETIEINFNTVGIENVKKCKCIVYNVSEPYRMSEHSSAYTLYFASEETFNSIRYKNFTGHRTEISNIVQVLYDRMKRSVDPKPIRITKTKNIEHFVFTGNEVIDAIHLVSDKAISQSDQCGYIFYEDMDQFNFIPLEEIYTQDPIVEFAYKNSGVYEDVKNAAEESFCTYQDFEILKSPSYIQRMKDGMYGGSWLNFAITDKAINVVNYDYLYNYDKAKSLAKSPIPIEEEVNQEYSDKFTIKYSLETEYNYEAMLRNKIQKERSSNFAVSIGTFGNSELRVGQVCKANIPNWSPDGMQPTNPDRDVYTGKFLIAEIKHVFNQKLYTQRIKIVKDAFEEITK